MKQRNIVVCILLSLVTCGIYGIYWMIVLNDETNALSGRQGTSGGLVFLFSLITCGIYALYWMYQMGNAVEMLHDSTESQGEAHRWSICFSACSDWASWLTPCFRMS